MRAGHIVIIEAPSIMRGDWAEPPHRRDLGRSCLGFVPGERLLGVVVGSLPRRHTSAPCA